MEDQNSINGWQPRKGAALCLLRKLICLLLLGIATYAPAVHAEFLATSQFWDANLHLERQVGCQPQKTKDAFCAQIKPCVYVRLINPYRYCQTKEDGRIFDICRDSADSCEISGSLDLDVPISPICVPDVQVWAK